MRSALTDGVAPFAHRVFEGYGCHPQAIEKLHDEEASTIIWLLAAILFRFNRAVDGPHTGRDAPAYQGWPNIFWHPIHRAPLAEFWGRWHPRDPQAIEWDADTLRRWLGYARRRLDKIERWLIARYMVVTLSGANLNMTEEAQTIMGIYQARLEPRS